MTSILHQPRPRLSLRRLFGQTQRARSRTWMCVSANKRLSSPGSSTVLTFSEGILAEDEFDLASAPILSGIVGDGHHQCDRCIVWCFPRTPRSGWTKSKILVRVMRTEESGRYKIAGWLN